MHHAPWKAKNSVPPLFFKKAGDKKKIKILSVADVISALTFTILGAISADERLSLFFLFFLENRIWHFMQIV